MDATDLRRALQRLGPGDLLPLSGALRRVVLRLDPGAADLPPTGLRARLAGAQDFELAALEPELAPLLVRG